MKPSRLVAGLISLFVAFTALEARADTPANQQTAVPPASSPSAAVTQSDLTDEILYDFLVAEIAGQRGHLGIASDFYLKLARETGNLELVKRATEVALFARRPQQALQAAEIWQQLAPDSLQANQANAVLLLNAGKLDQASDALTKLIQQSTPEQRAHWFFTLNALLGKVNDKSAALKVVAKLTQPYPDMPEAQYALALAQASAGDAAAGLASVRNAEKLRPDWEPAVQLEAQILQHTSTDQALTVLKQFLDSHKDAADTRLAYAKMLARTGHYAEARDQFDMLLQRFPSNTELMVAMALIEFQLGHYDQTDSLLQKALEKGHPDQDALHFYLGQNAEASNRIDDAKRWYKEVQGGEYQWDAALRLSTLQAATGNLKDARATLHRLKPTTDAQRIQLLQADSQLLSQARQYEAAFKLLAQGLQKYPDNTDLLYDQAMVAEKLNKLNVLESNLRRVIELRPDNAQVYNALGYTLADRTNRLDEAETLLNKALRLSPNDPYILDSIGWLYFHQGKLDEAITYLKRAYSGRADPEIAAHLGEVLWHAGKRDDARSVWQEALSHYPKNEALLSVIRKFSH